MNKLKGKITNIKVNGNLTLVSITLHETITLFSIVIETPATTPYLHLDNEVNLIFKETEVILSTDKHINTSIENKIPSVIKSIETGELLSKINLNTEVGQIDAVVSSATVDRLSLKQGMEVFALIKLNEIMLSEQ